MKPLALTLSALFLSACACMAAPEGEWPEEALSVSLSKPQWVLVVPAWRNADGSLNPWPKDSAWAKEWVVPRSTPDGLRTVAIVGDSEDVRTVGSETFETMDAASLGWLAGKYKAPAIAVAIEDEGGLASVAGWIQGEGAAWRTADGGSAREASLAAIDEIFSGRSEGEGTGFDVAITGQREAAGRMEYRIEISQDIMADVLRGVPGLDVVGFADDGGRSVVVSPRDGQDIEAVLRQAGITVRANP